MNKAKNYFSSKSSSPKRRTFSSSSKPRSGGYKGGRSQNGGNKGGYRGRGGKRGGGRKMPTFNPSQFINKNPVDVVEEVYKPKNSFKDFNLSEKMLAQIEAMGIKTPSPIQDQIIGEIINGHDVIGLAETGTGKTAAFLIPLIEKTLKEYDRKTLILAPTRELAIQIEDELKKLAKGERIFSVTCVGGMNIFPQIKALKRRHHFIIGTPGRVLDLINRGKIITESVNTVVLDEADRMLDMGFINDIKSILENTPKDRETLFFSATMSKEIEGLVNNFLINPVKISVKKKDVTNSIEQDVVPYEAHTKFETLLALMQDPQFKRVIIFGAMKHSVSKLAKQLQENGVRAESIHGNKSHIQRQRSLRNFKEGKARVLVATDVAARGIHVDDVSHVINYDLPNTFDDYVHRIGRTGRGTKRGKALTFVTNH